MTPEQRELLVFYMQVWRNETSLWIERFDIARVNPDVIGEELAILSNYFLTAAGCVYYHALELERDKQNTPRGDVFVNIRVAHPRIEELRDRRDMLQHGILSRNYNYTNMRSWQVGEQFEEMLERVKKSHLLLYQISPEERQEALLAVQEPPKYRVLTFEWVDKNNQSLGDVGTWQHDVADALDHLIPLILGTQPVP